MRPIDRVPADAIARQWEYLAAASNGWGRLWRRIVAAWRCARVAGAHLRRQRAWHRLRATNRALRREIRRVS